MMAPEGFHTVSVDKNSLKSFWREAKKLGFDSKKDHSSWSVRAQSELFQKYFKISLTLIDSDEKETPSFEETLKNIELKTKNIVTMESALPDVTKPKKRKIKTEPKVLLQDNSLIDNLTEELVVDQDTLKKEEQTIPEHHPPCLDSYCNEEVCKRFSLKLEVPDEDIKGVPALNLKNDVDDVKSDEVSDENQKVFTPKPLNRLS